MIKKSLIAWFFFLLPCLCVPSLPRAKALSETGIDTAPLVSRGGASPTHFELIPPNHTQIDFVNRWEPKSVKPGRGIGETGAVSGVCIGDYDADGRPDLFLTRPFGGNRLYRNLGDFRFEDVTKAAGLTEELEYEAWGAGPCFVDFDNDGDFDLYVCSHRRANRLYVNQGDGTFIERAKEFGLDYKGASVTMAFCDYDLDGDLDAYLVTNRLVREKAIKKANLRPSIRDGRMRVAKPYEQFFDVVLMGPKGSGKYGFAKGAELDHFYRNENGKFLEATREVLGNYSSSENFFGHAARWFDYDRDGYPDLYVSNDFFGPDQLFHNNGDGTMTDVTNSALPHIPWYSMGSDAADINNDGLFDFMASDMAFTTHYKSNVNTGDMADSAWFLDNCDPKQQMSNALFLNTGADRFLEAAAMAGVSNTDWTWAIKFADLDNDGRTDIYITNGYTRHWFDGDLRNREKEMGDSERESGWNAIWKNEPPLREKNIAYRNVGDLRFEEVSTEWGLDFVGASFGSALGDLDGDGDLDIVTVNFEDQAHVYRNDGGNNHVIAIELQGTKSNRMGIGAIVEVETESGIQIRDLPSVRGFMSADQPRVFFGLGESDSVKQLVVRWPSGIVQQFQDLPADRLYTVTEAAETAGEGLEESATTVMFEPIENLPKIVHRERDFDDFAFQPLLPNRLSKLGPGIACGDVNGDGWDDFYIAGSRGQSGRLLVGTEKGLKADNRSNRVWRENREGEELAPLFFDADGDGDQDLYVVRGSNEFPRGSSLLQDLLYLNAGDGTFSDATAEALPSLAESGSTVVAGDFDRDGDLDLFVGGRVVPGSYPETPRSVLLRNEGRTFTDVTDQAAPGLSTVGMVTSAIWSDVDQDGWLDLLVTCEWGPVSFWQNRQGDLKDATKEAGLDTLTGWWNGIAAGDIDNDGDQDYVVSNFGLNTKYHASPGHPAMLFYGDMDDNGHKDIVEAKYVKDDLFPVRGRSCSTDAIRGLAQKCDSFHQFASMKLDQLYGLSKLYSSQRMSVTTLESGVLFYQGDGSFQFQPLPRVAQVSPAFAPVVFDANGDGYKDIYIVQNFFNPQRETVRMDGGVSQLLLGDGRGNLRAASYREQGLIVPDDGKAVSLSDITRDGKPDLLITNNSGPLMAFENCAGEENRRCSIKLDGKPGNPTAVGSLVTVKMDDGSSQMFEIHAGGGYLSQSSATLFVGLGKDTRPEAVTVRWPDGSTTTTQIEGSTDTITIDQPGDSSGGQESRIGTY